MQATCDSLDIQIPTTYPSSEVIDGFVKKVSVPVFPTNIKNVVDLSLLNVTSKVHHLEPTIHTTVSLSIPERGGDLFNGNQNILSTDENALFVNLTFSLTAKLQGSSQLLPMKLSKTITHLAEENYGVGSHQIIFKIPALQSFPQGFPITIDYEIMKK
jgi:hypothetical protein